jgi:hypothetical protein
MYGKEQTGGKEGRRCARSEMVETVPYVCSMIEEAQLIISLDNESHPCVECIVYTWDYQTSIPVWNGIRVQPVLSDEVMTFKSLIVCHKLVQEGHPVVRTRRIP